MNNDNCIFCKPEEIKYKLPNSNSSGKPLQCNRCFFENDTCFAILKPEQHTHGETLLILSKGEEEPHKKDITDNIEPEKLSKFFESAVKIAKLLKKSLINKEGQKPEKIYVFTLCDGIKHFHFHLFPRYPFTATDKGNYIRTFLERDGADKIIESVLKEDIGGFWYIAERERNFTKSEYWNMTDEQKAKHLSNLAEELRNDL